MYFAANTAGDAEFAAGDGVAEFVASFNEREANIKTDDVAGVEDIGALREEGAGPIGDIGEAEKCKRHESQPNHQTGPTENPAEEGHPFFQEAIGIEEGNADEHDVHQVALDFALDAFFVAAKEAVAVGGEFGLEEIGGVKLAEELDDFALGGGIIAEVFVAKVPSLADGAFAIEEAEEIISGLTQAEKGIIGMVLNDVPSLATVMLARNLDRGT